MKKNLTARVLALLLFAVMLFNMLPLAVFADAPADPEISEVTNGAEGDDETPEDEGEDDGTVDYSNAVDVSSADELEVALNEGTSAIRLVADFELDRTFYVISDTVIIADEMRTLKRADSFGGDIFVVGENSDGTATEKSVTFTLGKPDDITPSVIVIDGNSENMTADVVGTVIFVRGGSKANLYHNVTFTSHKKVGNVKTLGEDYKLSYPVRIGGAVAIVSSKATMRIYGGLYTNNTVNDITDSATDEGNISSQGGVIYNYGTLDIFGGTFSNNHAGRGGAFYNYRTMNIYNADIKQNSASSLGGAIYVPNSTAAYLYIGEENDTVESKVYFTDNISESNAGAIYAQHIATIKNAEFVGNISVDGNGGAISAGAMQLAIEDSVFEGNTADGGYGGAVYITGNNEDEDIRELIVGKTVFNNNSSTRGGAVYMSGAARGYFSDAEFSGNASTTYAGAVYGTNATIEINGAEFSNNTATSNGGAIALYSASVAVINNAGTEANTANLGGFVYVNASNLDIYNSSVNKNSAANNGGAVYAYTNAVFNAYNTEFNENSATTNGGAVMIYNGGTNSVLHTCEFLQNTAGGVGGAMYISNKSKVDMYSIIAKNNSADKGGFMYETTSGTVVTLVGLEISGNTATTGGPIIWGNTNNAKLYIDKLKYVDNDYTGDWNDEYWSAAIYNLLTVYDQTGTIPEYVDYNGQTVVPPTPVSVTNVETSAQLERALQVGYTHIRISASFEIDRTFYITSDVTIFADEAVTLTRAADFFGDIFVVGEDADADAHEATLTLCKTDGSDAALTIYGNSENMTGAVVGTVIFVCAGSVVNLGENLIVDGHTKTGNDRVNNGYIVSYPQRVGGAVAIIESKGIMNIYGGTYSNNRTNDITDASTDEGSISGYGGAFYNYGTMSIYGGRFEGNHAGRGGAFYNYRKMYIYNATVIGNTASTYGGAIYTPNSDSAYLYIGLDNDVVANGKVYFTNNSAVSGGGAVYANNQMVIKNTVFDGNSVTGGNGGALYASATRISIDNSEFKNNTSSKYGGVVYLTKTNGLEDVPEISVTNSLFNNNTATTRAGCLYMSGGSRVYFYNTDFVANSSADGGVFYVNGANLEIDDSDITGNSGTKSGGVMALYASSAVLLNDIRASENTTDVSGGFAYMTASSMDIYNSVMSKNTAVKNSGVVYAYTDAVFNAYNTVFSENSSGENGGALNIYNGGKNSVLHSCTFDGNVAGGVGGGMYISNKSMVDMYNITAENNSADKGGFVYETTAGTVVNLIGVTLSGNTATSGGPIIWGNTYNAKLYIDKEKYTDLDATGALDDAYWAVAIYNKLTYEFKSSEILKYLDYGNEAYDHMADAVDVSTADELESAILSGVKYIRVVADFELDRAFYITGDVTIFTTITHTLTRAPGFGGDIFVVGEDESGLSSLRLGHNAYLTLGNPLSVQENLLIIDGNEENMTVDVTGSVLFITESAFVKLYTNLTVENCRKVSNDRTVSGNYILSIPNRIGGTLAIVASGTLEIYGGNYRNNTINEELNSTEEGRWSTVGGLIFNNSNLTIYGGRFEGNTGARGGVIYNYRVVRILGGSFINNSATVSGGVYYAPNSASVHFYIGSSDASGAAVLFEGNTAKSSGGVIYASTLTANVIYGNASFISNKSTSGSGGAICMYGQLTVRNSVFERNTSINRGGAIYVSNSSLESVTRYVEVTNCIFTENAAVLGGAISLYASSADYPEGAIITVTDSTFTGNKATLELSSASAAYGGAIYADRKVSLTVNNSDFTKNEAATEAGAVYLAGESVAVISDSSITDNTSGKYGGAISVRSSYLDIANTEISNNKAVNNGGAIYVSYQSNREINSKVTLVESTFSNNTTEANGGAIYATRRNIEDAWNILTISKTAFNNNSAGQKGGALYTLANVGIYAEDVTFTGNTATFEDSSLGGAWYVYGSTVEINGADFAENKASGNGGALYLDSSANVIMNNVTTSDGNSAAHGGFAYMIDGAKLDIYNSVISSNAAEENGGAIYVYTNSTLNAYDTEFSSNTAGGNGGACMIYNGGSNVILQNCDFVGNSAGSVGGAVYISNKSLVDMYNITAENNSADKGGFMYETTSGTVVNLVGLTVSGNTATTGGAVIWGNTLNAKLNIDKSQYTDLDVTTELDDAYWAEAIYNLLTVAEISGNIPEYDSYVHEEPEEESPVQKPVISVDHVFDLSENSSNGYINSIYDEFPILDNSSNFMSDGTTYFENINGGTVSVDSFVYDTYATDGNVNVGLGLLIYQSMLYKKAHPEEDVSIAVSSYRFSIEAALNINRNSRYFGYMRNLYGQDYDQFGFVRISYLLVTAAKMGINVTVIGHIDGYPISESDPNLYEYFTGHLDTPCDPAYTEGVVGDHMNFAQCYWTLTQKGGTDMMHNKMCAVSHYIDMNGEEHRNAVFSSSSNLDGINSKGYNGNWKLQTATIVSDHEYIYRVAVNYMNLVAEYCAQEKIYELQDIMSREGARQVDLILAGRASEIPSDEQIVYLGTENDDVFELYFTPFPGGTTVWDEKYNPYTKYIREMYNSEDSIIFVWNAAEYNSNYTLGHQLENIIVNAFYNNKNVENKFFGNMENFDKTMLDGLKVGEDIGYISVNQHPFGAVHNKDILLSYVKGGQRYYVSLLNSCNQHSGSMCYQSNFMLVIKETDCDEDSVFFNMADLSTTGIVEHTYGEEQIEPATESAHGYYYVQCEYCDKRIVHTTIHNSGEWITDRDPIPGTNGLQHKECTVCSSIVEIKETVIEEVELENNQADRDGVSFNAENKIDTGVAVTPLTFEAIIQLSKDVNDRGGVIVSNYDGVGANQISLEVFTYGRIRLYTKSNGIKSECIFNVDVRSNSDVHLAITVEGRLVSLYLDGVLCDTKTLSANMPVITEPMFIGGDNRINNYQYFKGKISSVALFDDVRSPAEIAKDRILVLQDTEGLLYSRIISTEKLPIYKTLGEGMSFTSDAKISVGSLSSVPLTIEAIVQLPKDFAARSGIIFGNYDGSSNDQLNLEIFENGAPRLYVKKNGVVKNYLFNADIRSDSPVHMAITVSGNEAKLYINGVLVDTVVLDFELPTLTEGFKVGGDNREGNVQYFKGTIYGLGLYSNARSAEQIVEDCLMMDSDAEELLYLSYYDSKLEPDTVVEGATFKTDEKIELDTLDATPHTIEATIRVLPDEYDRVGVIVGNYNNSTAPQINLEIFYGGNVRFFYNDGNIKGECTFFNRDIRSYTTKHIAVTVEGRNVSLYVDGILVGTKTMITDLPNATENFVIGGDNRVGNAQFFKGEIYSVHMFSDVRTQEEILEDSKSVAENADSLIYSGEFAQQFAEDVPNSDYRQSGETYNALVLDEINGITSSPYTFEAMISVPEDINGRAGVIVGNYIGGNSDQISVEIYENGRVRLFFVNNENRISIVFTPDIRSGKPTHIAITVDGTLATLYINGETADTVALPMPIPAVTQNYTVGGDRRFENSQYFKGVIYSVALFGDVRTADEIKNDLVFVSKNADNLMYSSRYANELCLSTAPGMFHNEGEWIIDRAPTEQFNGLMHKECTVCGRTLIMREISNTRKDGEHIDYTGKSGLILESESDAVSVDALASAPKTFEVLIKLDPDYAERAGVIFGSYDGSTADGFNIEVYTNGQVRIYYKVAGVGHSYVFSTDVRSDKLTHIAVTVDNLTARLYVGGEFCEEIALEVAPPIITEGYNIGNDRRPSSGQYFKGTIYNITLFEDIRSADEIAEDALKVMSGSDGVIYSKIFSE